MKGTPIDLLFMVRHYQGQRMTGATLYFHSPSRDVIVSKHIPAP